MAVEEEKALAAEAAADLVVDGMVVGLGTGSTVGYLLPALGARRLEITCIATSPTTESLAVAHGLHVVPFDRLERLDLAIDGADQVDPARWLIKGGGGAHTREKIVAAAADRFIVIVSSNKMVSQLRPPVPLELESFGLSATLHALGDARVRSGAAVTPDGGVLADYLGEIGQPMGLAARLASTPGVVSHGLFPPEMVDRVLVGRGNTVEVIGNTR
jgi:ribose 5-phosphate isomerase A